MSGITTTMVEQKPISERVRTTGVITYDERRVANLSARTTGTVWQVCRHVGETVRKGDVLVVIDAVDVGQSKSEFLSALVARESKAEILANLESVTNGTIPPRQVREAKVALREARIHLLNAEQTLVNLGFSLRAADYEILSDTERADRIQFLGLPEAMVKDLDRAATTSNLLPIRATFDGVVLKQDVVLGETAVAGNPVMEIADTHQMWLKLDVPKEDASRLALGQSVSFNPDGLGQDLHGSITWISTEMNEQTRTLQIRAEVENPVVSADPISGQEVRQLRANTFGTGTVTLRNSSTALVVPVSAIVHDDSQPLVFVRTADRTFERINVVLGIHDGDLVEIQSDKLQPGLEVVTNGGHVLKSEWVLNHVASASP
ncbi:MAG: efflux RND transporter periplasmic adaptor subunit [Planctomycetes bacterium]|nr:efflux RND transporter periplasmic adaptor subunit [Planctomycetota bacterium]